MPRAADFSVIVDAQQSWKTFGEMKWTLPNTCDLNSPSVLAWILLINTLGDRIHLDIRINGIKIYSETMDNEKRYLTLHEVVNPGVLRHGENVINFLFSVDDATFAAVSDVVLW